jgi:hypothetical protein
MKMLAATEESHFEGPNINMHFVLYDMLIFRNLFLSP